MSHGWTDWQALGVLPLQDHHPGVPSSIRQQVVAGRIIRMEDPERAGGADDLFVEVGAVGGLGSLGDVHPWRFWQTQERGRRGSGSWSQAFASIVVAERAAGGGPTTPRGGDTGAALAPIAGIRWQSDERYRQQSATMPAAISQPPRGSVAIAMASTDESQQVDVTFGGADPRLWAPHASGPSECGTVVCDLQPEREACMDGATRPGQGGRQALIQGAWRVVAMPPAGSAALIPGTNWNGIAWNLSLAEHPGVAGFGMVFAKLDMTGGGPTTGGGHGGGGPITPRPLGLGETDLPEEALGSPVGSFGRFAPRRTPGQGVAFLAHLGASGPIHAGHDDDKHRVGVDRDGHPMNSGHLAVGAYWYRSRDHDGPMLFEGLYPNPGPLPLISRVHLTWDGGLAHPFVGGMRAGMWRWYAEVPMLVPTGTPNRPPTVPPTGPPTRPRGPSTPGPTTPTPGGPGPGGGRPVPGGGPGGPTTPRPVPGGGPGGPTTPRGPGGGGGAPGGGGVPGSGPGGPTTPRPSPVPDPDDRLQPDPDPRVYDPFRNGELPLPVPDDQEGEAPGSVDEVGQIQPQDHAAWLLHFPHLQGQTGMTWRPQLWRCGQPSFLHSPNWDLDTMRETELRQPQVLAMHAFGSQEQDGWDYVQMPESARARGGTTNGGVLLVPPEWEPEDVLGICGHEQVSAASQQTAYFGFGTGVRLGFGLATTTGDLGPLAWDLTQQWGASRSLLLRQQTSGGTWTSVAEFYLESDEPIARFHGSAAIRIPLGDNSERPSIGTGELRLNDETGVELIEHAQSGTWATVASLVSPAVGDMLYWDGASWVAVDISVVSAGDVLTWDGSKPVWQAP